MRTLLELGADTQTKTFRGERPLDLARRYSKTDCADCLIFAGEVLWLFLWRPLFCHDTLNLLVYLCAEAKQDLLSHVAFVKDLIADPGRNLTKEEKVTHFFTSGFNMLLCEQLEREWLLLGLAKSDNRKIT